MPTRSNSKNASTTSSKLSKPFSSSKVGASSSSSSKKVVSSSSSLAKGKGKKEVVAPSNKKELTGLYGRLYKDAKKKMGTPIHRDGMDDIETILLQFDHEESFGPCSRISRLERFERAEKLGLNPDPEIGDILRSQEGQTRKEYRDSVFVDI
ncbi:uncharacterized protein JCM6883_007276 [Sporobolomyces salmoneus]|uniref:uncharacterized protein n=1 Tax=Sporobolomyces salmoneus TaxID=183962 RepID=UPI00316FCDD6